jgi:hypothetical protein
MHAGANIDRYEFLRGAFGAKVELYGAILKLMVVLRHLVGSDPSIEVADEERRGEAAITLHFEARPPKAALSIEQDTRSVVLSDALFAKSAFLGDASDVTQVTRTRGIARWFTLRHWVILLESNWVVIVVGLSALVLVICAIRLYRL